MKRMTDDLNQKAIQILRDNELLEIHTKARYGVRVLLNKAIRINQTGEPFTMYDFRNISKSMWGQLRHQAQKVGIIEKIYQDIHGYYRVIGFPLNDHWEERATKYTGVSTSNKIQLERYLDTQDKVYDYLVTHLDDMEQPALHNIRLHFRHDYLYYHIKKYRKDKKPLNIDYNESNKFLTIKYPKNFGEELNVKIILSTKNLVQVIINNTMNPIAYDQEGIRYLIVYLENVRDYLCRLSIDIPFVYHWKFVRADFGVDCKRPLNKMYPTMEFQDISGALVRFYSKKWSEGERRLRVETIINPNKSMKEMLEELIPKQIVYEQYPVMI